MVCMNNKFVIGVGTSVPLNQYKNDGIEVPVPNAKQAKGTEVPTPDDENLFLEFER